MDDRLAADVEGGVDDHRASGQFVELFNNGVIERIDLLVDGMNPGGKIHVRDRRDDRADGIQFFKAFFAPVFFRDILPLAFQDVVNEQHVGRRVAEIEIRADHVFQDRGGKGPEGFPELDLDIHDPLHFLGAGIANNAPVPEGAGAIFHSPMVEAYDLFGIQQSGNFRRDFVCGQLNVAYPFFVQEFADLPVGKDGPRKEPFWES